MAFTETSYPVAPLRDLAVQDRRIASSDELPYLGLANIESGTGSINPTATEVVEGEGTSTSFLFDDRHILYGKLRPYLNKTALPDFSGRCSTEIIPLLPKEGVDREYLGWLLRSPAFVAEAMKGKTGSRMPRADMKALMGLEVPAPDIAEQRRIALVLEEQLGAAYAARRTTELQSTVAAALTVVYLREMFDGEEAETWQKVRFIELLSGKGSYGTSSKANSRETGLPVLRMGNIQDGAIDWADLKYIELPDKERAKYLLGEGDIVFNRTNSAELVGKTAVFDGTRDAVFASYLIRFRANEEVADPRFLAACINSSYGRRYIEAKMTRAIGQVNISASVMHEMPVPTPPLQRQREIVAALTEQRGATSRLRSALGAQLTAIDALPSSLLREAFAGRL